jgi:hypothetical protein
MPAAFQASRAATLISALGTREPGRLVQHAQARTKVLEKGNAACMTASSDLSITPSPTGLNPATTTLVWPETRSVQISDIVHIRPLTFGTIRR